MSIIATQKVSSTEKGTVGVLEDDGYHLPSFFSHKHAALIARVGICSITQVGLCVLRISFHETEVPLTRTS